MTTPTTDKARADLIAREAAAAAEAAQAQAEVDQLRDQVAQLAAADQARLTAAQHTWDLDLIDRHQDLDAQLQAASSAANELFKTAVADGDIATAAGHFAEYRGHRTARYTLRTETEAAERRHNTGERILPSSDRLQGGPEFLSALETELRKLYESRSQEIAAETFTARPITLDDLKG